MIVDKEPPTDLNNNQIMMERVNDGPSFETNSFHRNMK